MRMKACVSDDSGIGAKSPKLVPSSWLPRVEERVDNLARRGAPEPMTVASRPRIQSWADPRCAREVEQRQERVEPGARAHHAPKREEASEDLPPRRDDKHRIVEVGAGERREQFSDRLTDVRVVEPEDITAAQLPDERE